MPDWSWPRCWWSSAAWRYFPDKGNKELTDPQIGKYLNKYAGQQMTNGAQAKAYADHFIAVHLKTGLGVWHCAAPPHRAGPAADHRPDQAHTNA